MVVIDSHIFGVKATNILNFLATRNYFEVAQVFNLFQEALKINFFAYFALRMQHIDYYPQN